MRERIAHSFLVEQEEIGSEADLADLQMAQMHRFLREFGETLREVSSARKKMEGPGSVNRAIQEKFEGMYQHNSWGNSESRSGCGSTVTATAGIRKCLGSWMQNHSVNLLLDIPCGDGNWQGLIPGIQNGSVQYYGYDISPGAVSAASKHNKGNIRMHFGVLDLVNQVPPEKADMIMVKEVIQHLPLAMGLKMLKNAKAAGVKWLAVTSNPLYNNTNVEPGEWFQGPNAQAPPFNFGQEAARCGTPGKMGGENDFMLFNLEAWKGGA
jgi:SAM-dependent methyltransferase